MKKEEFFQVNRHKIRGFDKIETKILIKPFLKWAGGKTQLLETFNQLYPQALKSGECSHYIEPFIG